MDMDTGSQYILPTDKVATTVVAYYRQVDTLVVTAQELATWFDGLPAPLRLQMHTLGLCQCLTLPTFRRYVLERHGYSMREYMATYLTSTELMYWVDDDDGGVYSGPGSLL